MLSAAHRQQLDESGYLVLPDLLPAPRVAELRKPQQQYQKALLRAETFARLTSLQRQVLALDDAENDRLSTQTTRMSGFLK